jgi:putative membrane protein
MNFIIKLFLNAVAVVIASYILSGIHVENFGYAFALAFVLAILNVSLKPVLILFTLPATILTFGIFLLVINAAIIMVADWLIGSGFNVDGWGWAILFSLLLSILNSILEKLVQPATPYKSESETKIYDKDGNRIA